MLKQLFSREIPFERLSAGELQRLDGAFRKMVAQMPSICYWVHRLDAERLLITDFFHLSMLRYRGLEVVLLENGSISYYRLPGAKIGGTGHVPAGDYRVRIVSPAGAGFLLDIRKNHLGRLEVQSLAPAAAETAPATHVELPLHVLETAKFADELKSAIASGVEWTYRSYRRAIALQQADMADELRLAPWLQTAQDISPEADTYLWMLNQPIA
ncbi:hypothetical protein [Collimonas humicola]|uniref:hypothetical protein n=1 Tax=Collimonas humicola TaxID=2825886 RepID=UPI001B8CD2E6|nr:hypothetical protein [Collimonas humicola]